MTTQKNAYYYTEMIAILEVQLKELKGNNRLLIIDEQVKYRENMIKHYKNVLEESKFLDSDLSRWNITKEEIDNFQNQFESNNRYLTIEGKIQYLEKFEDDWDCLEFILLGKYSSILIDDKVEKIKNILEGLTAKKAKILLELVNSSIIIAESNMILNFTK